MLEEVDSDHLSMVVWIKGGGRKKGKGERGDRESRGVWTKRGIEGEGKGVEDE